MKKDNFQTAIDLIDEDFIKKVDNLRNKSSKKRKPMYLRYIAIAACFCIAFTTVFFAFNSSAPYVVKADDLMEGIVANDIKFSDYNSKSEVYNDFAIRLFTAGFKNGENTLISPLSVMYALAMTANGADGETLAQMEQVLGMTVDELNNYLYSYLNSRYQTEKYKFGIANSIWFKDANYFSVNRDFLQNNADFYGADIYKSPFDSDTLNDINNWVNNKTDGMIPSILDEIPDEAIMYLINALSFDAEWQEIYMENQIKDGEFTLEDGTKQKVEFMHSSENKYIETEDCKGLIKYYKDRKYAFVALLPNDGVGINSLIASLDGSKITDMLSNLKTGKVSATIPKFQTEYSVNLKDTLVAMGMPDAFDPYSADFSKIGSVSGDNIFLGRVLHKTKISVDEKGTKAGAATVVDVLAGTIAPQYIYINLDRPFVYMLIDCETSTPFFIGTMMNPNA